MKTARSQGAYQLARCGRTQVEIAQIVGANQSTVHRWVTGAGAPGPGSRQKLEAEFGIPASDWDARRTNVGATARRPEKRGPIPESFGARLELLDGMLRAAIQRALEDADATPAEQQIVLEKLIKNTSSVAAMKGELDITKRVLSLPAFKRAVQIITEAARPWPDASAAIAAALRAAPTE